MLETNNSNSLDIKYVKEESIDKLEKLFGKIVQFFNNQFWILYFATFPVLSALIYFSLYKCSNKLFISSFKNASDINFVYLYVDIFH